MKKMQFWRADWFVGLLVVLLFLFSANGDLMQSLERKAYDLGVRASSRTPSDRIAVIAIDDQSIANLGRWPWPRGIQAEMLDILAAGHAKVIGNISILSIKPDLPPCVVEIINKALAKQIEEHYQTGNEMAEAIRRYAASLGD
jgi:eukaryotic-like serine/threonine-protein kinase